MLFGKHLVHGESFWQKDSLITHVLFELYLFRNLAQCTFFYSPSHLWAKSVEQVCKMDQTTVSVPNSLSLFQLVCLKLRVIQKRTCVSKLKLKFQWFCCQFPLINHRAQNLIIVLKWQEAKGGGRDKGDKISNYLFSLLPSLKNKSLILKMDHKNCPL